MSPHSGISEVRCSNLNNLFIVISSLIVSEPTNWSTHPPHRAHEAYRCYFTFRDTVAYTSTLLCNAHTRQLGVHVFLMVDTQTNEFTAFHDDIRTYTRMYRYSIGT